MTYGTFNEKQESNSNTKESKDGQKTEGVKVPSSEQPGHKYDVYDENGQLIQKNVSVGKDGKVDVNQLPEGKYSLVSQDGGESVDFEVNKDGQLPQTGLQDYGMYVIVGIVLLAFGAMLIRRNRKVLQD